MCVVGPAGNKKEYRTLGCLLGNISLRQEVGLLSAMGCCISTTEIRKVTTTCMKMPRLVSCTIMSAVHFICCNYTCLRAAQLTEHNLSFVLC